MVAAYLDGVEVGKFTIPEEVKTWMYQKARWLSVMRSTVTIDSYTGELVSDVAPEIPTRLIMQLRILYICLKSLSKDYTDKQAMEIILRILHSSAREIRVNIYDYLQNCSDEQTSSAIAEALKMGKKTIITELNILWNLGLIKCRKAHAIQFSRECEISYWSKKEEPIVEETIRHQI